MQEFKPGDTATISVGGYSPPGVYTIDSVGERTVLLTHPLMGGLLMRFPLDQLNTAAPPIMGSIERGLFFCLANRELLDHSTIQHVRALSLYFATTRRLTSVQKYELSKTYGGIARILLNDELSAAIQLVVKNKPLLDDFNLTWYNNFKKHFEGGEPVLKKSKRISIFNMAGFILSELAPVATFKGGSID